MKKEDPMEEVEQLILEKNELEKQLKDAKMQNQHLSNVIATYEHRLKMIMNAAVLIRPGGSEWK